MFNNTQIFLPINSDYYLERTILERKTKIKIFDYK